MAVNERSMSWETREAVVLLRKDDMVPGTGGADTYFIGLRHYFYYGDGYSITSQVAKHWLPEDVPQRGTKKRFMQESGGPTFTLDELKQEIDTVE